MLYIGITRAQKRMIVVGEDATISSAVERPAPGRRACGPADVISDPGNAEVKAFDRARARKAQERPFTSAIGAALRAEPRAAAHFADLVLTATESGRAGAFDSLLCVPEAHIDVSSSPSRRRARSADLAFIAEDGTYALLVEAKLRAVLAAGQLDDYLQADPRCFTLPPPARLAANASCDVVVVATDAVHIAPVTGTRNPFLGSLVWANLVDDFRTVKFASPARQTSWDLLLLTYKRRGRFGSRATTVLPPRAALVRTCEEARVNLRSELVRRGVMHASVRLVPRGVNYYVSSRGQTAFFVLAVSGATGSPEAKFEVRLTHSPRGGELALKPLDGSVTQPVYRKKSPKGFPGLRVHLRQALAALAEIIAPALLLVP